MFASDNICLYYILELDFF